jgi:hypothetical protein
MTAGAAGAAAAVMDARRGYSPSWRQGEESAGLAGSAGSRADGLTMAGHRCRHLGGGSFGRLEDEPGQREREEDGRDA